MYAQKYLILGHRMCINSRNHRTRTTG